MIRDEINNLCNNETSWTTEEVIKILNTFQKLRMVKITNFENLTISLRHKIDKEVEADLSWINEYSALWAGKKSEDYYLANTDAANLKRLRDLLKECYFTKEEILQGTKNYLREKESSGYLYCKKSHKFLYDIEGSVGYAYFLAVRCGEKIKVDKVESI